MGETLGSAEKVSFEGVLEADGAADPSGLVKEVNANEDLVELISEDLSRPISPHANEQTTEAVDPADDIGASTAQDHLLGGSQGQSTWNADEPSEGDAYVQKGCLTAEQLFAMSNFAFSPLLRAALASSGLMGRLLGDEPFTLFAPTQQVLQPLTAVCNSNVAWSVAELCNAVFIWVPSRGFSTWLQVSG